MIENILQNPFIIAFAFSYLIIFCLKEINKKPKAKIRTNLYIK